MQDHLGRSDAKSKPLVEGARLGLAEKGDDIDVLECFKQTRDHRAADSCAAIRREDDNVLNESSKVPIGHDASKADQVIAIPGADGEIAIEHVCDCLLFPPRPPADAGVKLAA